MLCKQLQFFFGVLNFGQLINWQTALWGNGNFVLCDVFLFYKSGHRPFKGSGNEGFYKSANSLKCTAPFFKCSRAKPHPRF